MEKGIKVDKKYTIVVKSEIVELDLFGKMIVLYAAIKIFSDFISPLNFIFLQGFRKQ